MITIYNEVEHKIWSVVETYKNKYVIKNESNENLNIDINTDGKSEYALDIGQAFDESNTKPNTTYHFGYGTEIGFSAKSGNPYISKISDKMTEYERNIIFFTIDLKGHDLVNVGVKNTTVYEHDYDSENHILTMVLSADSKDTSDYKSMAFVYIITSDGKDGYNRLVYRVNGRATNLSSTSTYSSEERIPRNSHGLPKFSTKSMIIKDINGIPKLAFPVFRPRRPSTNVICCSQKSIQSAIDILTEKYRYVPDSKRLVLHTPADSKELKKKVDFLVKYGIKYITYFFPTVDKKEVFSPEFLSKMYTNYRGYYFNHIAIMDAEGKIYHIC